MPQHKTKPAATTMSPPRDAGLEIQTWLIKYLVAAARTAMNTLFNTTVAADENYRENYRDFRPEQFYRVAFVKVTDPLKVEFQLHFDKDTLIALTKILLPTIEDLTEDITDSTATELLNLIYNGAKSRINEERGFNFPSVIPVLVDIKSKEARKDPTKVTIIPMVTPVGTYYLEVDFSVK